MKLFKKSLSTESLDKDNTKKKSGFLFWKKHTQPTPQVSEQLSVKSETAFNDNPPDNQSSSPKVGRFSSLKNKTNNHIINGALNYIPPKKRQLSFLVRRVNTNYKKNLLVNNGQ